MEKYPRGPPTLSSVFVYNTAMFSSLTTTSESRVALLCLFNFSLSSLLASVTYGQEGAIDDITDNRRRYSEAVALTDDERYEEALVIFEELQRIRPHAVVLYNIAWCLSRLGRDGEAFERFDEYLASGDESPERRERSEVERARLEAVLSADQTPSDSDPIVGDERPDETALSTVPETVQSTSPGPEAPIRHRVRPGPFWAIVGITLGTTVAMSVTGGVTLSLRRRWLDEGDVNDRDVGRRVRTATDVLLVTTLVGALSILVLGLFTNFRRGEGREQSVNGPEFDIAELVY